MNPVGVAAGGEEAGDEPLLVEFTVEECIGAGAKNASAPTVRAEVRGEFLGMVVVALLERAGVRELERSSSRLSRGGLPAAGR